MPILDDFTYPTKKLSDLVQNYKDQGDKEIRDRNCNSCDGAELQQLYEKDLLMTERKRNRWEARQSGLKLLRDRKFNEPAKIFEGDNIINYTKTGVTEKPAKTAGGRTNRTKQRTDVKARSVNLGGLIGLWKGIESLEKDEKEVGVKERSPVITRTTSLHSRTPSAERKPFKERKNSVDKKTSSERKNSVGKKELLKKEVAQVEQASKDKGTALKKEDTKDANSKDAKKSAKHNDSWLPPTSNVHTASKNLFKQNLNTDVKRDARPTSQKDDAKQTDGTKGSTDGLRSSPNDSNKVADSKRTFQRDERVNYIDKTQNLSHKSTSPPNVTPPANVTPSANFTPPANVTVPTKAPVSPKDTDEKSLTRGNPPAEPANRPLEINDTPLSVSTPDLPKLSNSRPGSFRKESVKRHSFRRRSKIESSDKNLAEDFDRIFKRLSIGSELTVSEADITSILAQVSQNESARTSAQSLQNAPTAPTPTHEAENNSKQCGVTPDKRKHVFDIKISPPTIADSVQKQPNSVSKKSAEKSIPVRTTETSIPIRTTGKNSLVKTTEKNTPTKTTEKSTPTKTTEKNTPVNATEKYTPTKTTEKNTPAKSTEKNTPAKTTEKNTHAKKDTEKIPNKSLLGRKDIDNKTPGRSFFSRKDDKSPDKNSIGKKEIGRGKVSRFEEATQRERSAAQRKDSTSSKPAKTTLENDEKTQQASECQVDEEEKIAIVAPKTATQSKLLEIAARKEALRRKYLERSHSENSIALEKRERFQRQGFAESENSERKKNESKQEDDTERMKSVDKECEIATVTTDTLTPDTQAPEDSQDSTSCMSAESVLTQISNRPVEKVPPSGDGDKKKKKLIRKITAAHQSAGGSETPPVRRRGGRAGDVNKILRRLSLNIPPPTPEEIEEEFQQGQDLTEGERKKLSFERRHRTIVDRDSTDDASDHERKIRTERTTANGDNVMECNKVDDLDEMIASANDKAASNNLSALSELKFKAMRNHMQRSNSDSEKTPRATEAPRATGSVSSVIARSKLSSERNGGAKEKSAAPKLPDKKVIVPVPRGKVIEQVQKAAELDTPKKMEKAPAARKDRMLNREHPSQRTFQKQSEWLQKIVNEAVQQQEKLPNSKPRECCLMPVQPETRTLTTNPNLDPKAISENVVVEPMCLPERKAWLEQLVRRNSTEPKRRNRLSKTKSLCNLSSFGLEDEDDEEMISLSQLDIDGRPLARYESVEEITKSIDVENRGNAYSLPSTLRKRRSIGNIENFEHNYNSNNSGGSQNISPLVLSELRNKHAEETNDDKENKELDPDLKEVLETIELPNILERMQKFQQKNTNSSQPFMRSKPIRRPRNQRPKSYAGEHLNQYVFENGCFRPKNEQATTTDEESNENSASSIGKMLMGDNKMDQNNNQTSVQNEFETSLRKRQHRRSFYQNSRILAEIAEMEQREIDVTEERTKAAGEFERQSAKGLSRRASMPIKEYERKGIVEEKTEKLRTYPKGLEAFLKENEVRS